MDLRTPCGAPDNYIRVQGFIAIEKNGISCASEDKKSWEGRIRTCDAGTKNQSLNHLATSQYLLRNCCSEPHADEFLRRACILS